MTTRAFATVLLGLVLTACAAGESTSHVPGPSRSPSADVTPPADCVNPPPDVTTLIEQEDSLACYGGEDLTVDAHLTTLVGAIDCPGQLEPAWLGCGGIVELRPLPGTSRLPEFLLVARSQDGEPLYAVLHPDIAHLRERLADVFVTVTGHYDDPAAQGCHNTSWPDANPPTAEEVIHGCRSTFVITALEQYEPDPATDESTPAPEATSALAPGGIVQAVDTDIVVRSAPGTGTDSEIYPHTISPPTLAYVFAGPVPMDGYDWYQVVPADLSYLPSPYELGWVAAGSREGEPWIAAAAPDCPQPTLEEVVELSGTARLACYADESLTLDGRLGGCTTTSTMTDGSGSANLGLPWSGTCDLLTFNCCPQVTPFAGGMTIRLTDDAELPTDAEGRPISVTGHFDDAAAASCEVTTDSWMDGRLQSAGLAPPPGWGAYLCRMEFVVTGLELIPGP